MATLPQSFVRLFNTTAPEFPCTLKADIAMRVGFPCFAAFGILGWYFSHIIHSTFAVVIMSAIILVMIGLTVAAYSFRLKVDDDGMTMTWILGERSVKWTDMARVERAKNTFSFYDRHDREVVPLSVLPYNVQKAIADKGMAMVTFKLDTRKQKYPVLEQWTR